MRWDPRTARSLLAGPMRAALAFVALLATGASAQQASLPMSGAMLKQATGIVVPGQNLAPGTLRVRVRVWVGEEADNPPAASTVVELHGFPEGKAPIVVQETTDRDGAASFTDLPDATSLRVEVVHDGVRYPSQPFTRVAENGLMLVMLVYPSSPELRDTHVEHMLVMADGTQDGVRVLTALNLQCTGERAVAFGADGLVLPLPAAARDIKVAQDASFKIPEPAASVAGTVVVLRDGLAPDVPRAVIISYRLEKAASVDLAWSLPLPVKRLEIHVPRLVEMRLDQSSLGSPDSLPEGQLLSKQDLAAGSEVKVTLKNVPDAAELFTDDAGVLSLEIDYEIANFAEEAVGIWQVCTIKNRGNRIYRNADGVYLSVAKGFVGMPEVDERDGDISLEPMRGVRVAGPIEPGGRRAQFGYYLPIKNGTVTHVQETNLPVTAFMVHAAKKGDLRIVGLGEAQEHTHSQSADKVLVAHGAGPIEAGATLAFGIEGLPRASGLARTLVTVIAAVALLLALASGERERRSRQRGGERRALETRREQLFEELVALEAGHGENRVGDADYGPRRAALLSKLESVTVAITATR